MKFLIFGGTGFVGRNLISYLKKRGEEVFSISRSGAGNSKKLNISEKAEFDKIHFHPDVIVNCASRTPSAGKISRDSGFLKELFTTNVVGAANISNWAVQKEVPIIYNCSTLVVVNKPWPNPLTEISVAVPEGPHVGYAMSKLSQEQIMNECVRGTGTEVTHLRISAVYGKDMSQEGILFSLLEKLNKEQEILLTDAEKNSLDFIHVKDISKTIYKLSRNEARPNILNLASGKPVNVLQLAQILKDLTNSGSKIENSNSSALASKANISVKNLEKHIGPVYYDFTPLKDGLKEMIRNYDRIEIKESTKQ